MPPNADNAIEYTLKQKNETYFDCMSRDNQKFNPKASVQKRAQRRVLNEKKSFAKQEIHLSDLSIVPQGYESIAYFLYALLLPYGIGYLFLISILKGASFSNSPFANSDNFLIVWIVGYEVLSILALLWIFKLFLGFDTKNKGI